MKKIGRPRKANRKEQISVNLPKHIIAEINDSISWQQSRSVWIETAIVNRLRSKTPDVDDIPLNTLLYAALHKENCPAWLVKELQYYFETIAKKQSAEIVE